MEDVEFQGGSIGRALAKKKIVLDLIWAVFAGSVTEGYKSGHLNAMPA